MRRLLNHRIFEMGQLRVTNSAAANSKWGQLRVRTTQRQNFFFQKF